MKRILTAFVKRVLTGLLLALLLAAQTSAAGIGQSRQLLKSTDDDGYTCEATTLGSYAADTMRQAAGTDFAFLPSGLLGLNLQPGEVDEAALALSFPEDETVYSVTLTAEQLREVLALSGSRLTVNKAEQLDRKASQWGGFLQISGLRVTYNVPALPERRIWSVQLPDRTELNLDGDFIYTAAVPASMLDATYGYGGILAQEGRAIGQLRELLARRIAAEGIDGEPEGIRVTLYGARVNEIINYFPPVLIILAVLLMAVFGGHKWRRSATFER